MVDADQCRRHGHARPASLPILHGVIAVDRLAFQHHRPLKAGRPPANWLGACLVGGLLALAACSQSPSDSGASSTEAARPPDGTVEMSQVQAAFIGSGNTGSGTLTYRGRTYPFTVAGLGIGGIGVSKIEARGEVYDLSSLQQFPGTYAQGRYGFALGTKSAGDLWMKNGNGVVMHLVAKRTGLMLSLGGDAVVIRMGQ